MIAIQTRSGLPMEIVNETLTSNQRTLGFTPKEDRVWHSLIRSADKRPVLDDRRLRGKVAEITERAR